MVAVAAVDALLDHLAE